MTRPILALGLAAVLALTGCGSQAAAPSASSAAGSAAVAPASATPAPTKPSYAAGATVDKAEFARTYAGSMQPTTTYRMVVTTTLTMGQKEQNGTLTILTDNSNPNVKKTRTTGSEFGMDVDTITIGDTTWSKNPGSAKYTKTTTTASPEPLPIGGATDPAAMMDNVQKVTFVGPESVDGVLTSHFQLLMTTNIPGASATPGEPRPFDVWVDQQGRLVKLAFSYAQSGVSMQLVGVLSGFGEPVDITAPPASQVEG